MRRVRKPLSSYLASTTPSARRHGFYRCCKTVLSARVPKIRTPNGQNNATLRLTLCGSVLTDVSAANCFFSEKKDQITDNVVSHSLQMRHRGGSGQKIC
ncbi:hypothetical protein CONLIGDRAFT_54175 [Coniochaeta ligniaria NRRL 30616]|uniref:Uncharacterized protein n=1 Tax=Coniochaeta ligniaria NRRL 30616 TaxID=1408157 RepID=A0A1J7K0V8_9PEZI|nr:hypothetical protein CONLIGDRAFT_54175 [Coniochaeta ligniaria NRRL 30616]